MPDKLMVLADIATELLVAELDRRAVAKNMSTERLLQEARSNWDKALSDAENLARLGHEEGN